MSQAAETLEEVSFPPVGRYELDPAHTSVEFVARHMLSKVRGRFDEVSGSVEVTGDGQATVEAQIQAASISTNQEMRDGHLKSPDFFNAEKFPTMTYKMKSYEKIGDNQYRTKGDLTLLGMTKEIVLTGTINGLLPKDPMGNTRAGFSAHGKINRQDFGMKWSKVLDNGGLVVGDDVDISLEIEVIKQK